MAKVSESTRQSRLERIMMLLRRNPDGLTEAEIAQALQYERRTTNNYLQDLFREGRADRDGRLWYPLASRDMVLRPFKMAPEEAMVLYLAARLFVKQSDERNETAELVLERLADVLSSDMGLERDLYAAARELSQRPQHAGYEDVFRTIMRAYIYRRKVALLYRPYNGQPFETVFSPYLLEPSAIGFATYAIGYSDVVRDLRTFKIERIVQAKLTRDEYDIPDDFPGLEILRSAWSIFYGEDLTKVVLRFRPEVARRVQETNWHPSQQLSWDAEMPEHLLLVVQVASTIDLIPWIRGWGANCEVLAPLSLRKTLQKEVRQMATLYGIESSQPHSAFELLWAKTPSKESDDIHPLICHLIDVAQVALALWDSVLPQSLRQHIADLLGLPVAEAGRLIAFWVGLHDLGKASPVFQRKYKPAIAALTQAGLTFPNPSPRGALHGPISALVLRNLLADLHRMDKRAIQWVAYAVGGHHGAWPHPSKLNDIKSMDWGDDETWNKVRFDLVETLCRVMQPPTRDFVIPASLEDRNVLMTLLSGLTSVADWIGSIQDYFPPEGELIDLEAYVEQAAGQAQQALIENGWLSRQHDGRMLRFDDLFPEFSPNDIQQAVITAVERTHAPTLAILEAPTGIGKTEAALYLADRWLQETQGRGIYVAMPTQATSDQMFGRVTAFLKHRYPEDLVNLQLLHGQALWSDVLQDMQLTTIGEEGDGAGRVAALSWFQVSRKRGLLAPFAVGTVDQALVSVLLTKHFFVRLFGLAHKVVIFDEVHAYDTYMTTLFCRLLEWLRRLGVSVIILSATLPSATRQKLLQTYSQAEVSTQPASQASYPCLTLADAQVVRAVALPRSPQAQRKLKLEWLENRAPEGLVEVLRKALMDGGRAVVICNTVSRAQEVFRAIEQAQLVADRDLLLFHSRFPYVWRQRIQQEVLRRFDKTSSREGTTILVSTQVVEQSLDLDFDLMITDLAPVDLILQRAGRLHRHSHHPRPARLAEPRLYITKPDMSAEDIPTFGADAYVYEPYVLLTTWLTLSRYEVLTLPDDTPGLIESVYAEEFPSASLTAAWQAALTEAKQAVKGKARLEQKLAREKMVLGPAEEQYMMIDFPLLEEESPEVHQTFQAMTRLVQPGLDVVCLFQIGEGGLALDPDGHMPIDLARKPSHEEIRGLLQNIVKIQHQTVVRSLLAQAIPPAWERISSLRYCRYAVFEGGRYRVDPNYTLYLSPRMGLEIIKDGQ